MGNPKLQITFTPEQMEMLKKETEKTGNSVASIVRNLVAEYLKKKEKEEYAEKKK